ncbi:hypothetical protein LBMAG30_28070 [Comamonadaceae bacterium]|nr:hypothetical protein LBMAG30_28070 [Comamonadaceae bacterium]
MLMRWGLWCIVCACLISCGGGGGGGAAGPNPTVSVPAGNNAMPVTVDLGPNGDSVNRLYASVTLCEPGNANNCQTIEQVVVDTGSTGLRLLASALRSDLNLGRLKGSQGLPLLNCIQFVDNTHAWGPVATADIRLGGKTAAAVAVQLMGDTATAALSGDCAAGEALNTVASLGGNGVLGLGLRRQDCGSGCVASSGNGYYFSCTSAACTSVQGSVASLQQQLSNPAALFASDNNGLLLDLPAVAAPGAAGLSGALIFGIGTQANNQALSATLLSTSTNGYLTTVLRGRSLNRSFLDTGSNALFFDSSTLARCAGTGRLRFYCPDTAANFSAQLFGQNGSSKSVNFVVDNAQGLFASPLKAALPTLAGALGDSTSFDWGLPFFYGRRVFMGFEGQATPLGNGPFYAF